MGKGNIIILNGVSSSGKTTLARALQAQLDEPYIWIAVDTFCEMYPKKFWEQDWQKAIIQVYTAMSRAIQAISDEGMNCIVDQVFLNSLIEGKLLEDFVRALASYPVLFVRVDCAVEELERREKARGDRRVGQANGQLPYIHAHKLYDCSVDTSVNTLAENTATILAALNRRESVLAFRLLLEKLDQTGSVY